MGWYCNEEVDALFNQALAERDEAKAAALYRQANEIIMGQDFAYAPKFVYYNPLVLHPSVKGFVNPPGELVRLLDSLARRGIERHAARG